MWYKQILVTVLFFNFVLTSVAKGGDSTSMLFDLSEVRTYDLTFYSPDYEEQLTENYETSEYLPARFTCGDIVQIDGVSLLLNK